MDTLFEKKYKELNKAQKLAVDTLEGPVMVIAGPGTGKTSILTLRIAHILKTTDTPPSGILAITFTDSGVKAMKNKLREIIGSRADEVRIHTFHGFAASIMNEFPEHFLSTDGFAQMTDIEADELINSILEAPQYASLRPLGKPDLYLRPLIAAISESKREALTPSDIKEYAEKEIERIKNDESYISTRGATKGELKADAKKMIERLERSILFADVYTEYEEKKKEQKLMDYDDLIFKVVLALGSDELLLNLVQEKFLYIHIDEHQDTNDSQNLMIRLIADFFENPNIFIVGDEKQAIMRFQGASVENFLRFEKAWPSMKVISLEQNYRSHQDILDASFGMIERNYDEGEHEKLRIKLASGTHKSKKPIDILYPQNREEAGAYLVSELERIKKEEPEKTVAIISRTNKDVDRVLRLAEERGIEIAAERSIDIFSHPIGTIFFSLAAFIDDPLDAEAFGKTLVSGLWGLDFNASIELLKLSKKGNIDQAIARIPHIAKLRNLLHEDSPVFFILKLVEESGFEKIIVSDPVYIEIWRGILSLAEKIVKQYNITDPALLIKKLISYKASAERKNIKISVGATEAKFKAMTAHSSKGLEFDYVFIPFATEESWLQKKRSSHFILPSKRLEKEGDDIRDARRLFYVALTRAREHAVILSPIEDVAGDLNTSLRFIDELDKGSVTIKKTPSSLGVEVFPKAQARSTDSRIIEYAKASLLENGLSVTALNHFLECPSQFLFKSVLRLPEAPSATAEKGIAMHTAFDHIWKMDESERTVKGIAATIETIARASVSASYLRTFEKEAVIADLLKNAPVVAKSLHPHFQTKGDIHIEEWSESFFSGSYKNENLAIRLHGKLDAVIDTGDVLEVFDYKTKKKMSVNEIKGETANSDGGYFRQLIFYRMLLEAQAKYKGKHIVPSLVFLTPDDKGTCHIQTLEVEGKDIADVKEKIQQLITSVWSGEIVRGECEEEKCEYCSLLNVIKNK